MLHGMAFSQTDLDTIDDAIKSAELSVRFSDGSSVTYRSVDELIKVRDMIKSDLAASTNKAYPRFQTARFDDA
jgi:hypothetical protein